MKDPTKVKQIIQGLTQLPDALSWNRIHRDIPIKISLHAIGRDYTPEDKGTWCYYIFIRESKVPKEVFQRFWLEDKTFQIAENCPVWVTHDYYTDDTSALDLSGGITFYQKHGHTEGHRCVEVGCDYNHIWDQERGFRTFEEVLFDAQHSVDCLLDIVCKTPSETQKEN